MTKIAQAVLIAALALGGATPALAKGGDGGEARERLKAAFAESRKANESRTGGGFSFFGLFGGDEDRDARAERPTATTTEQ